MDNKAGTWLIRFDSYAATPKVRLICFPFAGGGTVNYSKWRKDLDSQIELCAINLPGRERFFRVPCLTDYQELITALAALIGNEIDCPMIFFGHSFGALTAYFLTLQLNQINLTFPKHIFISGRLPPFCDRIDNIGCLVQQEFKDALIQRYQGIPLQILHSPEMLNLFLPIIQNDFKMYEQYPAVLARFPNKLINCGITSFGFSQDHASEAYQDWNSFTKKSHHHIHLPGGHFEILNNWKPITEKINHWFLENQ
jgi:surfactin synthase thioesterase subunit